MIENRYTHHRRDREAWETKYGSWHKWVRVKKGVYGLKKALESSIDCRVPSLLAEASMYPYERPGEAKVL